MQTSENSAKSNPESSEPKRKKRRWRRVVLLVALAMILLGVLAIPAGKHWLIPLIARGQFASQLDERWLGGGEIGTMEIHYTQPSVIRDVVLRDPAGREWLRIGAITLTLETRSYRPVLTEIQVDGLHVTAYVDRQRILLPMKPAPEVSREPSPYVDLQRLVVKDFQFNLVHPKQAADYTPGLVGMAHMQIDATGRLMGDVEYRFVPEAEVLGELRGDIDVKTLRMDTVRDVFGLDPLPGGPHVEPLVFEDVVIPEITFRDAQIEAPSIRARTCGASVSGGASLRVQPGRPTEYQLHVKAREMNLRELAAAIDPTRDLRFGKATAKANITGWGGDLNRLRMQGEVFLDDSPLKNLQVVGKLLTVLQSPLPRIQRSDLYAKFDVRDAILRFEQCQYADDFNALVMEPGGRVYLTDRPGEGIREGYMNFFVAAEPVAVLRKLPLVEILSGVVRNITRLKVEGYAHQPVNELVSKHPVDDLEKGVADLFSAILKQPGHIVQAIEGIGELGK